MPYNLTSPDTADFGVRFIDSFGVLYTPSSASITFIYLINNVSNSSTVDLVLTNGRWEVSWSSAGVDVPSSVTWTIISSCSPNPAQVGTIRVIDP